MVISKLKSLFYYLFLYPYYKLILKRIGFRTRIISPLLIEGSKNISLGSNVFIRDKVWLGAKPLTGKEHCNLIISDGCEIGNYNHIYATDEIIIGKNVLTADKVYISDNLHSYEDTSIPVIKQAIKQINKVHIGDGAWLGENVCVMGATVGKGCVIGANTVITKDIPDYCVVVGNPARIIKKYDTLTNKWLKINKEGGFE